MELFESTEGAQVKKLRESCDEYGRETDVEKTAKILRNLAEIYSKRSQKRSSLLCASVLLKASLARANFVDAKSVIADMKKLDAKVLDAACGKDLEQSLHEIAQDIFQQHVSKLRTATISSLPKQHGDKYTEKIRNAVSSLADGYLQLTKVVSDKCQEIIGTPPCKFSHIAIGSLPREEVSCFSSIDTALVLDNNAKRQENFEETMNYFRWYSLIFRTIFVYFGETPVDWMKISDINTCFVDSVTPKGLTFDTDAESRRSLVADSSNGELIGTTDDILKMVTDSIAKTGSFDVVSSLLSTRCITGSEGLHRKLKKRLRKVIYSNSGQFDIFTNSVLAQLQQSIGDFSLIRTVTRGYNRSDSECNVNTVSQFIDLLGLLTKSETHATFEVIKFLQSESLINDRTVSHLELAIAIESVNRFQVDIRKFSLIKKHEAHFDTSASPISFQAQPNTANYVGILAGVRSAILELVESGGDLSCLKDWQLQIEDAAGSADLLVHYGLYEEALSCTERHCYEDYPAPHNARISFLRGVCFAHLEKLEDSTENLSMSLAMLLSLPEADQTKIIHFARYLIGKNMLKENRLEEARENLFHAMDTLQSSAYIHSAEGKELHIAVLNAIGNLEYQQGEFQSALMAFERLHSENSPLSSTSDERVLVDTFITSGQSLFKLGRYKLCAKELEKAVQLHTRTFKGKHDVRSTNVQNALLTLGTCYSKLGRTNEAEKCLDRALRQNPSLEQQTLNVAHAKMAIAQCNLQHRKYMKASEDAFEALQEVFMGDYPKEEKLGITQASVSVILRCMNKPPTKQIGDTGAERNNDTMTVIVECATRIFDVLCEQKAFQSYEVERDKSALIRAIQQGLYQRGNYCILQKMTIDDLNFSSVLSGILEITISSQEIRDKCEKDQEYLCRISRYCNVRDSFSLPGSIIVMSGCVLRSHKLHGSLSDDHQPLQEWLSDQNNEVNAVVLHCLIKVAKHFLEICSANKKEFFLEFVETTQYLLHAQPELSRALQQEAISMLKVGADCWIHEENYEKALSLLNNALEFQEKLSSNAPQVPMLDSDPIIEKVGICLAKLGRWHEATDYLNRKSAITEIRRKSRALEEHSLLQVNVKSAARSFSLGNYEDAALMASETFHSGLGSDLGKSLLHSLKDSVKLVLKCALAVSVSNRGQDPTSARDVTRNVMDCAITLRTTLEDHAERLGGAFAELLESLYYACGMCHFAIEEFKPALKCFRKSRRMLKRKGDFPAVERPILLNIAKSQIALGKFRRAVDTLHDLLEKGTKAAVGGHLHPNAYMLLGVALCNLHDYEAGFKHLYTALCMSQSSESIALQEEVSQVFCEHTLGMLRTSLFDLQLD